MSNSITYPTIDENDLLDSKTTASEVLQNITVLKIYIFGILVGKQYLAVVIHVLSTLIVSVAWIVNQHPRFTHLA